MEVRKIKTKLYIIALTIIILCFISSCSNAQKKIEIYSFNSENDFMGINNGVIVITDELEKFVGGDLVFKGEELSDVKHSATRFYFYKDGAEIAILTNSVNIDGTLEGSTISSDMGSISSKTLFNEEDWGLIKNSLNFSLTGTFMNGENFEYTITLELKEIY